MSFYNDPRYFQRFSQELKSTVKQGNKTGYRGGDELKDAFDYFREVGNFSSLEVMKAS